MGDLSEAQNIEPQYPGYTSFFLYPKEEVTDNPLQRFLDGSICVVPMTMDNVGPNKTGSVRGMLQINTIMRPLSSHQTVGHQ